MIATNVQGCRTTAEAATMAGLDFGVEMRPVYVGPDAIGTEIASGSPVIARHSAAVVRTDTGRALKIGVSHGFKPLQNRDAFAPLDALIERNGLSLVSAGSANGGGRVWMQAEIPGSIEIRRLDGSIDPVARTVLVANAHDGTLSYRMMFVSRRLVRTNQLSAAARDRDRCLVSLMHRSQIEERIASMADALTAAFEHFDATARTFQRLAGEPMDREAFRAFARELLNRPIDDVEDDGAGPLTEIDVEASQRAARIALVDEKIRELEQLFGSGAGNTGQTRWDVLNAVTEHVDHALPEWIETRRRRAHAAGRSMTAALRRFDSSLFGDGARTKARALRLLTRW